MSVLSGARTHRARPFVLAFALALAACGARSPRGEGAGTEARTPACRVTLAGLPGAPSPRAPTRAIAHVTLPLSQLTRDLEARVPKRVAEERDRDIGVAGRLQIAVDRGPLALAVSGEALVVRAPLRARVDACAKGKCYASCEPEATATVTVPLRLTAEYGFAPSRAEVSVTRGCQVRALGGLLRIDVTPMVESTARANLKRVEKEIDARLPNLRSQAERLWRTLDRPIALPVGCVDTHPVALVQGLSTARDGAARLRFALAASPEVRARCEAPDAARALPPLVFDAALPEEDDVDVALVSDPGAVLVRGIDCGDGVSASGAAAWTEDGRSVALAGVVLAEADRARTTAPVDLSSRLARETRLVPLLAPDGLRDALPLLAGTLSDASVDVRARVTRATPSTAALRGAELVATVRLRGSVELASRAK